MNGPERITRCVVSGRSYSQVISRAITTRTNSRSQSTVTRLSSLHDSSTLYRQGRRSRIGTNTQQSPPLVLGGLSSYHCAVWDSVGRDDGRRRFYHTSPHAFMSERLLGHSPMSPGAVAANNTSSNMSAIPTAHDVTTSGGVWAPTSAKRDKLGELYSALEEDERSLDDAATPTQLYDLWLCEGVSAIAATADYHPLHGSEEDTSASKQLQELTQWLQSKQPESSDLAQIPFENLLQDYVKRVDQRLAQVPVDQCLKQVRDYMDLDAINDRNPKFLHPIPKDDDGIWTKTSPSFDEAVLWYRLQLARAAAQTLRSSWTILTKVSDQDIDRAAVEQKGAASLKVSSLSSAKILSVLEAFLQGTAKDRVDAIWNLMDRDEDDRLDEVEMNRVCELAIAPVQKALEQLLDQAMEASPILQPPTPSGDPRLYNGPPAQPPALSWWQRRKERTTKRRYSRMFQKALKRHFVDEVELAHRLRCIYAWANKEHQDNKMDSVLVENEDGASSTSSWGGVVGRKRYVELAPKISLAEFREVQQEHFTHLDRVGAEFVKSFREDMWIVQGQGRQNRELWRDCAIFMAVVCATDMVITML